MGIVAKLLSETQAIGYKSFFTQVPWFPLFSRLWIQAKLCQILTNIKKTFDKLKISFKKMQMLIQFLGQ